jgi:hypothetical protein
MTRSDCFEDKVKMRPLLERVLVHRVGLGRKRGRPFKGSSSPRDILLQNPFNFGNGFWMVHQVVTGWNYLL